MARKKKEVKVEAPSKPVEGLYKTLSIKGFRGFDELELADIGRINLILGANNTGKTSILEALFTHATGLNLGPLWSNIFFKRDDNSYSGALDAGEKLLAMFKRPLPPPAIFEISAKILDSRATTTYDLKTTFKPSSALSELDPREMGQAAEQPRHGSVDNGQASVQAGQANESIHSSGSQTSPAVSLGTWSVSVNGRMTETEMQYRFPPSPLPASTPLKAAAFHDIMAHRDKNAPIRIFSHLKRKNVLDRFTREMRSAFPETNTLDQIPFPDGSQGPVYVWMRDGRRLPLWTFGDGMRRWYHLLGNMVVYQDAVHCIEELDATLHPSAQREACRRICEYSREFNNQVFLTSHSLELTDAFLTALYGEDGMLEESEEDPARVFTLRRPSPDAPLEVWPLTGREAYRNRHQFDLELR
jgi:hypothetical protein